MAAAEVVVERYTANLQTQWDELVRGARAPHFLFERGYMDYHADRFEDHSLVVREGGRLLALLPANRVADRLVSHGGLTFGGMVSDRRMTADRMLAAFEGIIDHLGAEGVRTWVYKPVPHIYHATPAEEDLYALFRHGARLVGRDLAATVAPRERPPYSKGRRASVKRARGLTVACEPDLASFWAVEEEALARRHGVAPVHSAEEIAMLAARFPEGIRLFVARDGGGRTLGGVVIFETPVVAHAQYIATTPEGQEAGAVDAVVDHLLGQVYATKRWFDFGISTQEGGRLLNAGLARNKESYGARAVAYDHYELPVSPR